MSHYWTLEGTVTFERDITDEEYQAIADYFECGIDVTELLEVGIGWNCDGSITFGERNFWLDGNENHFPSTLNDLLKIVKCKAEGSGVYDAEDRMCGEWTIIDNKFVKREYSDIVKELRHDLAAALKGEYIP